MSGARAPALAFGLLLAVGCVSKAERRGEAGEAAKPQAAPAPAPPPAMSAIPPGISGDRDIEADIAWLGDAMSAAEQQAVKRLEARGHAAVPALLRAYAGNHLGGIGRARILRLLGETGAPEAFPTVQGAIDDRLNVVREAAIDAIAGFADPRATAALVRLLGDHDPDTVKHAALRLGERRDVEAVPPLAKLLDRPEQGIRFSGALGLARVGNQGARASLASHLARERDAEVRGVITAALADGGVPP